MEGRYTRCSTAHILIYSFEKDPNLSRVKCRDLFLVGTFCSRLQSENVGFLLSDIEMGGILFIPVFVYLTFCSAGEFQKDCFRDSPCRQRANTLQLHQTEQSLTFPFCSVQKNVTERNILMEYD